MARLACRPAGAGPIPPPPAWTGREADPERAIAGLLRWLAQQPDGMRNGGAFWVACRMAEGGLGQARIETLILPVARSLGLTSTADIKAVRATIASALKQPRRVA
jgi:hypothetical protein